MNGRTRIALFSALAALLGSLSLNPVFESWSWFPPVLGAIVVVSAAGIGARRLGLPQGVDTLASLAALLVYLSAFWAGRVAIIGLIPGPGALRHLSQVANNGFADIRVLSAPAPVTTGLALLTAGGVGLVAVLMDTLAAGMRRPAVTGIPLLALFAVPAAILPSGVGWFPFVCSAAGYLALLMADGRERVQRWGRPLLRKGSAKPVGGPSVTARPDLSPLSAAGRRIGTAAIALAVAIPAFVPGLHPGWFNQQFNSGSGNGKFGGQVTAINPIVSLKRDLVQGDPVDVISYRTDNPSPDYLRLTTLDQFDGTIWSPSQISAKESVTRISKPAGVNIRVDRQVKSEIKIQDLRENWLPVPMNPVSVDASGDWRYDPTSGVIASTKQTTRNLSYTVDSNVLAPSALVLNSVRSLSRPTQQEMAQFLELPAGVPALVVELAKQVTADAKTPYEQALALQEWFRSSFTYDLTVAAGNGDDALLSFLADKRGYCEQFASAMAVMARQLGIPARVDIGFTPGVQQSDGSWLVTTRDAHAWPELWFSGLGWLRFEPTPTSDGRAQVPAYAEPGALVQPTPTTSPGPVPSPTASQSPGTKNGQREEPGPNQPGPNTTVKAHRPFPVKSAVGGGIVLAALLLPYTVQLTATRRRWRGAVTPAGLSHAAWDSLGESVRDLGIVWSGWTDSPRRAAAELLATQRLRYDDNARAALTRLTETEERARYAPSIDDAAGAREDAERVRAALAESVPWQRRVRAKIWPTSSLLRLAGAWSVTRGMIRKVFRVADR